MHIIAGARQSPLSKAQYEEVKRDLERHHPLVSMEPYFVKTIGDVDLKTSLRDIKGQTNFFTKEIDELVLARKCRIGIHSAKDLPVPLPKGLTVAAITIGLDPGDALVLRPGESLKTLRLGAIIATSSLRRDQVLKNLRSDFQTVDLRGTIHERLEKLDRFEADGVVVAEAALIRLGLIHLNRVGLPGNTTPLQGKLAIVIREEDVVMRELLRCLDSR